MASLDGIFLQIRLNPRVFSVPRRSFTSGIGNVVRTLTVVPPVHSKYEVFPPLPYMVLSQTYDLMQTMKPLQP